MTRDRQDDLKKQIDSEEQAPNSDLGKAFRQQFKPGQFLDERYRLIEIIDRGDADETWLAEDQESRKKKSIRILAPRDIGEAGWERFHHEAMVGDETIHPNIAKVDRIIEMDGRIFIVMEHISGRTLADTLKRRGPLDLLRALQITENLLEALAYAHSKKIIHGQVTPHHVFLGRNNRPKLTAFGISSVLRYDLQERRDADSGTPIYMSPEQLLDKPVDERSDLYSLGVTLYEMLSGEPPFARSDRVEMRRKPNPLPSLPMKVEALITKLLAFAPANRFPTARACLDALKQIESPQSLRLSRPSEIPGNVDPVPDLLIESYEHVSSRDREELGIHRSCVAIVGSTGSGKSNYVGAVFQDLRDSEFRMAPANKETTHFLRRFVSGFQSGHPIEGNEAARSLAFTVHRDRTSSRVRFWRRFARAALRSDPLSIEFVDTKGQSSNRVAMLDSRTHVDAHQTEDFLRKAAVVFWVIDPGDKTAEFETQAMAARMTTLAIERGVGSFRLAVLFTKSDFYELHPETLWLTGTPKEKLQDLFGGDTALRRLDHLLGPGRARAFDVSAWGSHDELRSGRNAIRCVPPEDGQVEPQGVAESFIWAIDEITGIKSELLATARAIFRKRPALASLVLLAVILTFVAATFVIGSSWNLATFSSPPERPSLAAMDDYARTCKIHNAQIWPLRMFTTEKANEGIQVARAFIDSHLDVPEGDYSDEACILAARKYAEVFNAPPPSESRLIEECAARMALRAQEIKHALEITSDPASLHLGNTLAPIRELGEFATEALHQTGIDLGPVLLDCAQRCANQQVLSKESLETLEMFAYEALRVVPREVRSGELLQELWRGARDLSQEPRVRLRVVEAELLDESKNPDKDYNREYSKPDLLVQLRIGTERVARTSTVDQNYVAIFMQDFVLTAKISDIITFELWDEDKNSMRPLQPWLLMDVSQLLRAKQKVLSNAVWRTSIELTPIESAAIAVLNLDWKE